jgi:hypothetical protein
MKHLLATWMLLTICSCASSSRGGEDTSAQGSGGGASSGGTTASSTSSGEGAGGPCDGTTGGSGGFEDTGLFECGLPLSCPEVVILEGFGILGLESAGCAAELVTSPGRGVVFETQRLGAGGNAQSIAVLRGDGTAWWQERRTGWAACRAQERTVEPIQACAVRAPSCVPGHGGGGGSLGAGGSGGSGESCFWTASWVTDCVEAIPAPTCAEVEALLASSSP